MRKITRLVSFFLLIQLVFVNRTFSQEGVKFEVDVPLESGMSKARDENRLVFIDFYTTWCVPCKTMDAQVFTDNEVAAFMNSRFINLKYDAEAGRGVALAKQYRVRAFPTFVIINAKGEEVFRIEGASSARAFLEKLQKGLDENRSPEALEARYKAGERGAALINDYVWSVMESGNEEKGFAIVDDYFHGLSRKGKAAKENAFLYERYSLKLSDHKLTYLFANKQDFVKEHGAEWVNNLMHRFLRMELLPYANGHFIRRGLYKAEQFEALKEKIAAADLPDTLSFAGVIELAEVRVAEVPVGRHFLEAFERIAPTLAQRDAHLLLYNFTDFVGHEDPAVRRKAVALIEERLSGFSAATIGIIQRVIADLQVEEDAEGVHFRPLSFNEALDLAKRQQKLIFLDAYATWCGPCKLMDQQVFNRKDVGDFLNINFINLKIDMEKGEGVELAKRFQIRAYPTFFLINADGEVVHRITGYQEPAPLMRSLRMGMKEEFSLVYLTKQYEAGNRTPELIKAYVQALSEASEQAKINTVLNAYFLGLSDEERAQPEHSFCYEHVPNLREERIQYFMNQQERLVKSLGTARYEAIIDQVCVPILMTHQAYWRRENLIAERFPALDGIKLTENSETGALIGLFPKVAKGDYDQLLAYLDATIHRFSDRNQLYAMHQVLGIPARGTQEQRLKLQALLKRIIVKNNSEMSRSGLTHFLNSVEASLEH